MLLGLLGELLDELVDLLGVGGDHRLRLRVRLEHLAELRLVALVHARQELVHHVLHALQHGHGLLLLRLLGGDVARVVAAEGEVDHQREELLDPERQRLVLVGPNALGAALDHEEARHLLHVVDLELEVGVLDELLEAGEAEARGLLERLALRLLAVVDEHRHQRVVLLAEDLEDLVVRAVREAIEVDLREHLLLILGGGGGGLRDRRGRLLSARVLALGVLGRAGLGRRRRLWRLCGGLGSHRKNAGRKGPLVR